LTNITPEASAVILAITASPLIAAAHILFLRIMTNQKAGMFALALSFVCYLFIWFFVYALIMGSRAVSFFPLLSGICTGGFLCLCYAEAFSMLCRGFSFRIITDVYLHPGMSLANIVGAYGEGRGAGWLLDKRIKSMESLHLINLAGGTLILRPLGFIIGRLGVWFKNILKMGKGG
jgi:hypothetical protein